MIQLTNIDKNYLYLDVGLIEHLDRAKSMFTFISLFFDLYKWCIFLASTGTDDITTTVFRNREKLFTKGLIAVQTMIGGYYVFLISNGIVIV